MLCLASLFFAVFNLAWVVYFGADMCKNFFSFWSVLIGFGLHGYYTWFFWQRNCDNVLSIRSIFHFLLSAAITVGAYFIADPKILRVGAISDFGHGIPAALAGIIGIFSTALGIHYRMKSLGGGYNRARLLTAVCSVFGTFSSIYGLDWSKQVLLPFKIAISMLCICRVFEMLQQLLLWWRTPSQVEAQENARLLQSHPVSVSDGQADVLQPNPVIVENLLEPIEAKNGTTLRHNG